MQQDIRTTPKRAVDRYSSAALLIGLFVFVALAALAFGAWTFLFSAPIGPLDPLAPATTHAKGGSGAPVTVVVFGDYQCRACASFVLDVQPAIESDFVDEGIVRYVYRHYPTLGRESLRAAQASECWAAGQVLGLPHGALQRAGERERGQFLRRDIGAARARRAAESSRVPGLHGRIGDGQHGRG
jgi:hypothetical protein